MASMTDDAMPEGLRERKKVRTRADLQRHALRLFRDRGYTATTVDDIAAAAEVSRSTFFRYFRTKEEVVLFDDVDPLFAAAFRSLPAGTPLLSALRTALRTTFSNLDAEKRALEELRMQLARTVPEIAATLRARETLSVERIGAAVATALGRDAADTEVLVFAGMITGARLAAHALMAADPTRNYIETLDTVLEKLADGIPLADAPILTTPPAHSG